MWCDVRSQPGDRPGEGVGVGEAQRVLVPAVGRPDLGLRAGADDHGLGLEPGCVAQVLREQQPALLVDLGLEGPAEQAPLEEARSGR